MRTRVGFAIMRFFAVLFIAILPISMWAQSKRFRELTTADGLPQNSVECFAQDSLGFMWIGTQDGLVRYDGYTMKVFRNQPKDSFSLSDNFITQLLVDEFGGLWIGTRNGVNYYDESRDRFLRFIPFPERMHQACSALLLTDGEVLANIPSGPFYLSLSQENQRSIKSRAYESKYLEHSILALQVDPEIFVEISSDSLLLLKNGKKSRFETAPYLTNLRLSGIKLELYENQLYWMNGGIWKLDLSSGELQKLELEQLENIRHLNSIEAIDDELWIATDQGLFVINRLDFSNPQTQVYRHDSSDPFSINYDFIHRIFQDKDHRVWVGTANKGLNYYEPRWDNLDYLIRSDQNPELPNPLVWCSYVDSLQRLWVGTASGLALFEKVNERYAAVELPIALAQIDNVRDIIMNSSAIWIASSKTGLWQYSLKSKTLKNLTQELHLSQEMVDLEFDDSGRIWAGSYFGMYVIDAENQGVQRIDLFYDSPYTLDVKKIGSKFYVSHSNGLAIINPDDLEHPMQISASTSDAKKLPFSIVSCVEEINGKLWVGLYDIGLCGLNESYEVDTIISEEHGLAGHVVEGLVKDDFGRLWVSTNQGISIIDFEGKSIKSIKESDGLRSAEFALGAVTKDVSGRLYFGSVDGLLIVDPRDFQEKDKNSKLSNIRLSNLQINYTDYRKSEAEFAHLSLNEIQKIDLYSSEKVISFTFSALHFGGAEDLEYTYQLLGFDAFAVKAPSNQRVATYSNLPAGNYSFKVEAFHSNGESAAMPFLLELNVHPPFYAKWWFITLMLLALVAFVAGIVRYLSYLKFQKKLQELHLRERVSKERERISRDLHDSVGSQLTYMIGSLDNMAYKNQSAGAEAEEVNELSDFARGTMQQLREAIWVINREAISLEEFRLKLEDHCSKLLAHRTNIEWQILLEGELSKKIEPGFVLHLFRICQEAINNVVKHAKAKNLTVNISEFDDVIELSIKDDGVGFDTEARKMGHFGLDNIQQRVMEMGGEVHWESAPNSGTTLTIKLSI